MRPRRLRPGLGTRLKFRYPRARRFRHKFYTGWPGEDGSRQVKADESLVDLDSSIVVEAVSTLHATPWINDADRGNAQFIAVMFTNTDGRQLWTNYSKNAHIWMVHA